MIYVLTSIPFGAAVIYNYAADKVKTKCFTTYSRKDAEEMGLELPLGTKDVDMVDMDKARKWLNIMLVCYYPAMPLLWLQRKLRG